MLKLYNAAEDYKAKGKTRITNNDLIKKRRRLMPPPPHVSDTFGEL